LINSTISNNSSKLFGGGISAGTSTLIVRSSTITQNTTNRDGGGIFINPANDDLVAIDNTIIAKNFDIDSSNGISPDISGNFDTSNSSYNLIADGTGSNFTNGVNGNIVGTSSDPIDPLLGPLQDNGGSTFTHALLPASPAIDAANPLNNEFIDQRGVTRPQGSGFDIGAFEVLVSCSGSHCSCEQNSDPWNITNTNHPSACLTSVDTNLITPVDCFV
jgi:predicted outer membrane repeat protein